MVDIHGLSSIVHSQVDHIPRPDRLRRTIAQADDQRTRFIDRFGRTRQAPIR
jgi:hypothetical protein